ncbi:DUF1801 domain-containing protein [Sinomonas mesophila]|uniref:DUF1801 domain-containing protein n=1 Tax=Sinomonas mesophila TaxID=1531955 RepID=UPI0009876B37|nr:DUF1801 domain-containing protein [Sinomonas mesophila]
MAEAKTHPTDVPVAEFLAAVEPAGRREDGFILKELFDRVTGEEPVMWGPSMVGYGTEHYTYTTGREGDWFAVGFSPRKASISLYGLQRPGNEQLIAGLGKAKLGVACIWVGRLGTIDLGVLEELIARSWAAARG